MGFFNNYRSIGKINVLLKQIEPKVDAIMYEMNSPYPNRNRIRTESGTISVLMSEIMEIVGQSGNSVFLAPYYFKGQKTSIQQISLQLAQLIGRAERN